MDEVIASLSRGYRVGQVAISPDGQRVAWVEGGRGHGALHVGLVAGLDQFGSAPVVAAGCAAGQLQWTPDSDTVVFVSSCGASDGQENLYRIGAAGAEDRKPVRLSTLRGEVDLATVSPDGRRVAFLYVPGATRPAGALAAMNLPSGVIGEDGVEVQRLATVPLGTEPAEATLVSPANLHVYDFDWAPDSKQVAYVAAEPPGENNWWVARLYAQPLDGPARLVLDPGQVTGALRGLQMAVPRYSPDGSRIAFVGGLMSDQGVTGGDLWMVATAGGEPVNLTPGRRATVNWLSWGKDNQIFVTELAGGQFHLTRFAVDEAAGKASEAATVDLPGSPGAGERMDSLSATADRSRFAFRTSSFDHAPEIAVVQMTGAKVGLRLSKLNRGLKPAWGASESVAWTSDGYAVQGWLLLPLGYDPHKRYPMIVEVHGGPSYATSSTWGGYMALSPQAFSAMGYFVLLPNPRGSFGQGEAFKQANRKDFGYGDLRDILAGVDAVTSRYPVDANRVGLTGWSYGGFMSMFAVTQTHRFRAAVAGAGIANWQSYYGENSIDQWMRPFFGVSVYDDPALYAKSSAINYIHNVTTPTLVVVGDRDGECPSPQSFEFWHALRAEKVTTELVVYPNEGHGFSNPVHTRDVLERAVGWFNQYMPAE